MNMRIWVIEKQNHQLIDKNVSQKNPCQIKIELFPFQWVMDKNVWPSFSKSNFLSINLWSSSIFLAAAAVYHQNTTNPNFYINLNHQVISPYSQINDFYQ